jgi:hypothetical protein
MQHRTFILTGENLMDRVSDFVRLYHQEAYETEYTGGFMRVYEDYSFVNGNDIMVCIRVDTAEAEKGTMRIEIISGGGNSSLLLKNTWGSESRRIKHFQKELAEFCKTHSVNYDIENQ